MTKLIEDLKAAGWVETTLGECQMGEEVLLNPAGPSPRATRVTQPAERGGKKEPVKTSDGGIRLGTIPVLRAPRPECAPGTVALIRWREDQPPVRAWKVPGQWIFPSGASLDDDNGEIIRVLLPADQDTPPIEVTDEMVERGAAACYLAREENPRFNPQWDEVCEEFPYVAALYRRDAHAALKAALGGGES